MKICDPLDVSLMKRGLHCFLVLCVQQVEKLAPLIPETGCALGCLLGVCRTCILFFRLIMSRSGDRGSVLSGTFLNDSAVFPICGLKFDS